MSFSQSDIWHSPLLCGCVLERTHTWSVSQELVAQIGIYFGNPEAAGRFILEQEQAGRFNHVETTYKVLERCKQHSVYDSTENLAAELLNWGQNAWRPMSVCNCSACYTFDKRLIPNHVHIPLLHPMHTRCCAYHEHITDHVEHYETLCAESRLIGGYREKIAEATEVDHAHVMFRVDDQNRIIFTHTFLNDQRKVERILGLVPSLAATRIPNPSKTTLALDSAFALMLRSRMSRTTIETSV